MWTLCTKTLIYSMAIKTMYSRNYIHIYIYIYIYYIFSWGEESHDKDSSNNGPRRVGLLTNRCKGALVRSVLSSLVLAQGARARARWWLSGHTLLSVGVKRWEREVSCSLSGGQDPLSWRDLLGL